MTVFSNSTRVTIALAMKDAAIKKLSDEELTTTVQALSTARADFYKGGKLNYLEGTEDRYARLVLKREGVFREEALFRGILLDESGNVSNGSKHYAPLTK